jgi:hypothetical protein
MIEPQRRRRDRDLDEKTATIGRLPGLGDHREDIRERGLRPPSLRERLPPTQRQQPAAAHADELASIWSGQ